MLMRVRPITGRPIPLGRQGEHIARVVDFADVCDFFVSVFGEGVPELRYMRPGDTKAYIPAVVDTSDGCTWQPTSTDTAKAGTGKAELRWLINGKLAKSRVWDVAIEQSLVDDGESPEEHGYYPGPYQITPSDEEQVLATDDLIARENIVVGKIPSNYGHIDYTGFNLRVY